MNQVTGRGLVMADGAYVAFELIDGTLAVGDVVDGEFNSYGPVAWTNLTTGETAQVYVQQLHGTVEAANRFYDQPPRQD